MFITRHAIFELASTVLVLAASSFYARNIIRRQIELNKATWLMWAVIATLVPIGMYRAGTLNWQAAAVSFADVALFVLVCCYVTSWGWGLFELVCIGITGIAIVLWQTTGDPDWAIGFGLAAVFVASIPIFMHVRDDPTREKALPWLLMSLSSICELVALDDWSWQSWTQPATYLLVPALVLVLLIPGDEEPITDSF